MIKYLKKRMLGDMPKRLELAFYKVQSDINNLQGWVLHLNDKSESLKGSHDDHVNLTRKDITNINKWLQYLHTHNSELHKYIRETTEKIIEIYQKNAEMDKRLEKIEKGQVGTPQRTFEGHLKDKSPDEKTVKNELKETVIDKETFTGSQIELLDLVYHSDRPLSYGEIARLVGKKKKSIRNLIYELREKGIKIKDKPVGIRKKGFYLDAQEKIKVSGR